MSTPFTLQNTRGLELLGDTHSPNDPPKACVILMHGFKGYKDYGFLPVLAHDLCQEGLFVHRFNSSTSGMTNEIETFARPDLFELDTWTRQVEDIERVVQAVRDGEIAGKGLPIFIIGHSRGGASALLAAGRHGDALKLAGVITINAVDCCSRMPEDEQEAMLARGYTMTQSARTNQDLRINSTWLSEQLDNPDAHDVILQAAKIACPVCVIHGDDDQAVDLSAGKAIAQACKTDLNTLEKGNHVLNMPNPSELDTKRSVQLLKTTGIIVRFIAKHG
ncbi:MAG: alpha/beta fold hydrolase [Robiginitomaculum sp.]|nr:alpha/beta fold hydrolase [Robiginitomaculum sp.]PCI07356.1 MAG: hypothetical protein COB72_10380 [bacterium]